VKVFLRLLQLHLSLDLRGTHLRGEVLFRLARETAHLEALRV
jgi:hypothetical protein